MQGKEGPKNGWKLEISRIAVVLFVSSLLIPLVSADDTGLTRGSRFTITVTGMPHTPYYVWLTRTSPMSGEPGDQPPMLLANQVNIVKDPVDGPYVIGSYQINNGGGRTIREDVAPSTASMSSTQYYALVTTDNDGLAIVAFQTSSNTAMRTFSVKVENAQSAAKDNILVQRGDASVRRGSVVIDTIATQPVLTTLPLLEIPPITETFTTIPTTTAIVISPPATQTHPVPLAMEICIAAIGILLLTGLKSE
jgi:hypothetical protein